MSAGCRGTNITCFPPASDDQIMRRGKRAPLPLNPQSQRNICAPADSPAAAPPRIRCPGGKWASFNIYAAWKSSSVSCGSAKGQGITYGRMSFVRRNGNAGCRTGDVTQGFIPSLPTFPFLQAFNDKGLRPSSPGRAQSPNLQFLLE